MFKRNDFDIEISGAIVHISTVLTEKRRRGTKKEEYRVRVLCIYIFFVEALKFPALYIRSTSATFSCFLFVSFGTSVCAIAATAVLPL